VKRKQLIVLFALCALLFVPARAQEAMNNPYVDDKLFHFGFQIGMNFASFGVTDSEQPILNTLTGETEIYHARVSSVMPGFHVGFISDLKLCKYLNLRFCPGMQFSSRTLKYKTESGNQVKGTSGYLNTVDILAIPLYLPLYLKFSAARQSNYRPYVIAGGGVSFNVSRDKKKPVALNLMDYFCEVGFGVDFYFNWFKFCPEITYRIGFGNILAPVETLNIEKENYFYTNALSRLTSQCICITFNFE
jgi:hypothetical protein